MMHTRQAPSYTNPDNPSTEGAPQHPQTGSPPGNLNFDEGRGSPHLEEHTTVPKTVFHPILDGTSSFPPSKKY